MQVKMRQHHIPIRMAKTQNTDNTKCGRGHGATEALTHCWWECRVVQTAEDGVAVSYKVKRSLTICVSSSPPWYSPK